MKIVMMKPQMGLILGGGEKGESNVFGAEKNSSVATSENKPIHSTLSSDARKSAKQ